MQSLLYMTIQSGQYSLPSEHKVEYVIPILNLTDASTLQHTSKTNLLIKLDDFNRMLSNENLKNNDTQDYLTSRFRLQYTRLKFPVSMIIFLPKGKNKSPFKFTIMDKQYLE